MRGAVPPLSKYAFMGWCPVKAQGQLYLFTLVTYPDKSNQRYILFSVALISKDFHPVNIKKRSNKRNECRLFHVQDSHTRDKK